MKRRQFITLLGGAAATWPIAARAQQITPIKRIGLMANLPLQPVERFRKKLEEIGYIEGKNLIIEYRFAEGRDDRYPAFAAEFAQMQVDIIVVWGTPAAFAAKRATTKIPIVIGAVGDVLNVGLITSLSRPEANITGFIAVNVDLEEKRLELLKDVLPTLRRVGVITNAQNPLNRVNLDTARRATERLGVTPDIFEVQNGQGVEGALRKLAESRPDAALLGADTMLLGERKQIAEQMAALRIPAIYPFREYMDVGGLIIYGANLSTLFERAAGYVDRILRGEQPGNLPVQQATAFEVILNQKTAAGLGITFPPIVLARADEVIE
jgi:putative ABC transport system substrate-binding protein